ncbi:formylglycine-generating enzyme family protein [Hoeflea prorocentri]|uniref:SUMF1/EgtB/PvdO family nonheme iron enzyme n=1 Tax=Hoeflea prorocentri TaxID=1922333 RepID=A0A9X3UHR8_9HYPH|nr:SUMF1/EgtB/PvdO family nonheme iron enzyme [Hoeflea prorocentri]MCY6380675.1 SUMF1/EgtB/PvdO family nonheme iron enzyme [Hoeflea prorocentri]MDA5398475.1 SUMF1/EgtB/PvdO family nonheme iron enzyme [Hoeflea prorocentri]
MNRVSGQDINFTRNINRKSSRRARPGGFAAAVVRNERRLNQPNAPKLKWDQEDDEDIGIPDFLLKKPPARPRNIAINRQTGLLALFVVAFMASFGGALFLSRYLPSNTTQTVQDTTPQPPVTTPPVEHSLEVASAAGVVPIPEQSSVGAIPDNPLTPVMVSITGGTFTIPNHAAGDTASRTQMITLDDFRIATTEVTRRQWKACADEGSCSMDGFPSGYFDSDKLFLPITSVTTDQMMGFVEWINGKREAGEPPYRIPDEAEWIVAARGGLATHSDYPWGPNFDPEKVRTSGTLIPVEQNSPVNGLYGMSDNAAERVSGCWIMKMPNGTCFRNLGIVRGATSGRIDGDSAKLTHRTSRAKNIPYENISFRLAQ